MADPPHNDIDNAPPGDPPLPPAPRIPRTHTSPGVIAAFKALSFGAKLKKCKEIEEQNDARMLQSMKHFEDPVTFPDDGSEQASIFTLDPEDVRKLKVSSFAALFHSVMPSFIANFLAEEKIAEDDLKVLDKRGRDDNMSPEDMRLAKRRCMDGFRTGRQDPRHTCRDPVLPDHVRHRKLHPAPAPALPQLLSQAHCGRARDIAHSQVHSAPGGDQGYFHH